MRNGPKLTSCCIYSSNDLTTKLQCHTCPNSLEPREAGHQVSKFSSLVAQSSWLMTVTQASPPLYFTCSPPPTQGRQWFIHTVWQLPLPAHHPPLWRANGILWPLQGVPSKLVSPGGLILFPSSAHGWCRRLKVPPTTQTPPVWMMKLP